MSQTVAPSMNDVATFNAALALLQLNGERLSLSLGAYSWTAGVVIGDGTPTSFSTLQNAEVEGEVGGTGDILSTPANGVCVTYTGSATTGAVLAFNGPMRAALRNMTLDAAGLADVGLDLKHVFHGEYANLNVMHAKKIGINQSAYPAAGAAGVYAGESVTIFRSVLSSTVGYPGGYAWWLGNQDGDPGLDVSRCALYDCTAQAADSANSACFVFSFTDNTVLYNPFAYSPGQRRAVGGLIKPKAGKPAYPSEVDIVGGVFLGGFAVDFSEEFWTPDANCGRGLLFIGLHDGDMNDPTKNLWPESKNLGGREGINGFTHTFVILDRHQIELYRDGKLKYGVSVLDRAPIASTVSNTTSPANICAFVLPAKQLRVFDRFPHANAYKNDRKLYLELEGTAFQFTGVNKNLNVRMWLDGPSGSALIFDGDAVLASSQYWRMLRTRTRVFARNRDDTVGGNGELHIWLPESGGGAKAKAKDIELGNQKSVLAGINTAQQLTLRVEVTPGDPAMVVSGIFATLKIE